MRTMNYPVSRPVPRPARQHYYADGFRVNFGMIFLLVAVGIFVGYMVALWQQAAQMMGL